MTTRLMETPVVYPTDAIEFWTMICDPFILELFVEENLSKRGSISEKDANHCLGRIFAIRSVHSFAKRFGFTTEQPAFIQ
jgi:hypothetical protein